MIFLFFFLKTGNPFVERTGQKDSFQRLYMGNKIVFVNNHALVA